ncbi:oligosaccharide flippase family protein [Streptomyces sp. TG1A-60]|uniref:lipopolysaccharide biosynthesis protein n=1 Tax=Streptomyces sp. TG1A-60 TaxID=3129111 RepID=UPI0030D187AE
MASPPEFSSGIAAPAEAVAARVAGNSARLLAARVATALAGVASLPVVYGTIGARSYGVWALLTGLIAIVSLADLGLGSVQIREVARAVGGERQRQVCAVLGLGVVWGAVLSALALAGTAICWPWLARVFHLGELSAPARGATLFLLVGFLLDSLALPWRSVLEGTQRYGPVAWVVAGTAVLGAGLAAAVVTLGGGLVELAASVVVSSALRALMFVCLARRYAAGLTPSLRDIRPSDVGYVASYGSRVQVAGAAAAVNSETDRLVLTGFHNPSAVAGYDLGSRLVGLLRLPSVVILTAAFPSAAAAADDEPGRLDRLYIHLTRYLTAFAAIAATVLVVSADPLVRMWLGRPLPAAAVTIMVLAPGCAASVIASAAAMVTRAEGRPGCETRGTVLAAVLNLLLTVPLLRLLGPWGVPLATTLAAFGGTVYFFAHFHSRSRRPVAPLLRALWPPVFAAVTAGVLACLVTFQLTPGTGRADAAVAVACRGGLTVLVAAALLALLGFFGASDLTRLRMALAGLTPHRGAVPARKRSNA